MRERERQTDRQTDRERKIEKERERAREMRERERERERETPLNLNGECVETTSARFSPRSGATLELRYVLHPTPYTFEDEAMEQPPTASYSRRV